MTSPAGSAKLKNNRRRGWERGIMGYWVYVPRQTECLYFDLLCPLSALLNLK